MTSRPYRIHGLTLASELELPELAAAAPDAPVDIRVELGEIQPRLPRVQAEGPLWMAGDGEYLLEIARVARYRVSDGERIRVQPMPDAAPGDVRLFLLGSALGAVLHQRGLLALHAGAVEVHGQAVAFAGHSGAGKSTLVAHLRQRGHRMLGDDLLAVNLDAQGQPWAQPGFARLKLWADALQHLPHRQETLARSNSRLDKYLLATTEDHCGQPLPLTRLYILADNREDERIRLQPLNGLEAMRAIARETYKPRQLRAMGLEQRHFILCGRTAARIQVAVLHRPKTLERMAAVLDFLEDAWTPT